MKWIAYLLFAAALGVAQSAGAQAYQYNDRVTSQGVKSESFLKSSTYSDRVTGQEFKSNSFLKRNNYNDRVGRATNLAPQGYKQKSFLPRQATTDASASLKPAKRAPVMPLKPKGDNSNSGSIKDVPKLKKKDFAAPKTDGGYTAFDRYNIAVPEAPKLTREKTTSSPKPRLSPATPQRTHAPPAPSSTHRAPSPAPSPPSG